MTEQDDLTARQNLVDAVQLDLVVAALEKLGTRGICLGSCMPYLDVVTSRTQAISRAAQACTSDSTFASASPDEIQEAVRRLWCLPSGGASWSGFQRAVDRYFASGEMPPQHTAKQL